VKKPAPKAAPRKEVSVMAWIEDDQGAVLLVQQTAGQRFWTLPGGKVKTREAMRDALVREVREETNLKVESVEILHLMDRPERGAVMVLYRAAARTNKPPKLPKDEIAAIRYVTKLPKKVSPSAGFFWKLMREPSTSATSAAVGSAQTP